MKLYDHQIECIQAVEEKFAKGSKRTLAVLATGAGKTMIYLYLADKWVAAGKRVLILAHRRELIHQPILRAKEFFPNLYRKMGVVMANLDNPTEQVVVATIQTASKDKARLEKMGRFDYCILDECHHGPATTYKKLVSEFSDARWLGLTATPFRTDGEPLADIFDTVAYRYPITAAIDRGTLVPFDALGFTLPVSVEGVTETIDGWAEESLGDLLSADNALEVVYDKWLEYCKERRTICFTSSVAQAHATARYFREQGVKAEAVDGTTPKKVRDGILNAFRKGEIQMVANCQVWTEGVDVPEASAALMVCPTKSDLAYVQKLGRVLRTFPGKKDAVILDFAPLEDRNIVMAGDILGVPRPVKKAEEKAKKAGVLVGATRVDNTGLAVSVDPDIVVVEALKYLRKGSLAWSMINYMAVASVSDTQMLAVELPNVTRIAKAESMRNKPGWTEEMERLYQSILSHRLWVLTKTAENHWSARLAGMFKNMDETVDVGEKLTESLYQPSLAKKRRAWRNRPVTPGQFNYMKRLSIQWPENCTCGQAAQLICHELARRAVENVRKEVEQKIIKGA